MVFHYFALVVTLSGMGTIILVDNQWTAAKRYEAEMSKARDSLIAVGKVRADSMRGYWRFRSDSIKAGGKRR